MRSEELEKYAKEKFGDKWENAAANIGSQLSLDKNNSLSVENKQKRNYMLLLIIGLLSLLMMQTLSFNLMTKKQELLLAKDMLLVLLVIQAE